MINVRKVNFLQLIPGDLLFLFLIVTEDLSFGGVQRCALVPLKWPPHDAMDRLAQANEHAAKSETRLQGKIFGTWVA